MRTDLILPAYPSRSVRGRLLITLEPLSFWGGIDSASGNIIDPRSSRLGRSIAGAVLAIAELRGSSSTSAVLLELIHRGLAPAGILLTKVDAILVLGAIVGREMGWHTPAIVRVTPADFADLREDLAAEIDVGGRLTLRRSASSE